MENSNVKLLLSLLLSGVLLMGCSRRAVQGESDAGRVKEINHGEKEEAVRLQDLSQAAIISMHKEIGNAEPTNIKRVTEQGKVHYEFEAELENEHVELKIAAIGTIVEKKVWQKEEADDNSDEQVVPPPAWDPNAEPGSPGLPLQYLGPELPDGEAPDGRLMYSPGVQNIQISRANRKHPPSFPDDPENHLGWTYQHHVGIGCWKGQLYAVWDMTHVDEDIPPCHLVYSTSSDGFNWSEPKDLYPFNRAYSLRFYFFHSSNDRMLVFAAGYYPTDHIRESKKDRLYVRELTADHKLGEIYTLIKPGPGHPPSYEQSKDAGFLKACREALQTKPLLEQGDYGLLLGDRKMKWHDAKNWPGGKIASFSSFWTFGKSLCFYHRKDGALVATCKFGFVNISTDEGETWSQPLIPKGIVGGSGKLWAQKTPDDRYAMIYIPQMDHRYPMAITTSDDGITFKDMRLIHGEVPPQRYVGRRKGIGPQYLRGISEWGGDGSRQEKDCIWTVYSVSKKDIWVSRIPVPIAAAAEAHADDRFDNIAAGPRVPEWNTYSPIWAPVSVAAEGRNHFLQLEDREPTDYARAIRTFPQSKSISADFRVAAAQVERGRLEIELLGELGSRPARLILNDRGQIQAVISRIKPEESFAPGLKGVFFNKADFRDRASENEILDSLDNNWGRSRGGDWSARWTGLLEAPYSGEVAFNAEATDGLRLKIADKVVIDGLSKDGARSGKVAMKKGEKTPITLEFTSAEGKARLCLSWSWAGQPPTIVPAAALSHKEEPGPEIIDLTPYRADEWLDFKIHADCLAGKYTVRVNGREVLKEAAFAEPSSMVYALSFRTGEYRGTPSGKAKQDIPNSEEPLARVVYRVDDVITGDRREKRLSVHPEFHSHIHNGTK
ncbi:MAG: hypothetical protein KAT48_04015 [Bacteroidales bacterium]|nr:hypothetical protein [Bacteroidales bacterium]